jgi:5-methylcytosine-specific restriction protein A
MRSVVPPEVFESAFNVAVACLQGRMSQAEAKRRVILEHNLKDRTASGYVGAVIAMSTGKVYKTIISADGLRYMLDRISESGNIALHIALQSVMSHITYLEDKYPHREPGLRQVYNEFLQRLAPAAALVDPAETFLLQVAASLSDSHKARIERLKVAPKMPKQKLILARAFERNPDVVAETLLRASGTCEGCLKAAPFLRSDGSPYLEVHHRIPLSKGGEDTVCNAIALCPNCHREKHYGQR